jgi:hypothetical protein
MDRGSLVTLPPGVEVVTPPEQAVADDAAGAAGR